MTRASVGTPNEKRTLRALNSSQDVHTVWRERPIVWFLPVDNHATELPPAAFDGVESAEDEFFPIVRLFCKNAKIGTSTGATYAFVKSPRLDELRRAALNGNAHEAR